MPSVMRRVVLVGHRQSRAIRIVLRPVSDCTREQCLGMRQRITDECFGGLGHPDENGNRTTEDRAMDNVRNRINKC